jgi:hypothetical protein
MLAPGAIVGIVVGLAILLTIIGLGLFYIMKRRRQKAFESKIDEISPAPQKEIEDDYPELPVRSFSPALVEAPIESQRSPYELLGCSTYPELPAS